MTDDELASLNQWADRFQRQTALRIGFHLPRSEVAIAELMDATFEEADQDRKPLLAAVEMKLRLLRERVMVGSRN